MLRISSVPQVERTKELQLEGWLCGAEVEYLQREVARLLHESTVVLNLDGVRFIDEAGIHLLQCWVPDQVTLKGGTLFVRSLLKTHGLVVA